MNNKSYLKDSAKFDKRSKEEIKKERQNDNLLSDVSIDSF